MLRTGGFDGDGQGDRQHHGGPDKAVCVYPFDHYAHWEKALGRELAPAAFSENLTVGGIRETGVCVGDVFRVGGAVVQVCQPRVPCDKLARKNGERLLPKWMSATGYTGFYARVLAEGLVEAGAPFELVERHPGGITIADANYVNLRPVLGHRPRRTPCGTPGARRGGTRPVRPATGAAAARRTGRRAVSGAWG